MGIRTRNSVLVRVCRNRSLSEKKVERTSATALPRTPLWWVLLLMTCVSPLFSGECLSGGLGGEASGETVRVVRKAVGAGRWFPGKEKELKRMVDAYIEDAGPSEDTRMIVGVIAPHAGYIYSGKVAGYTFSAIRQNATAGHRPDTVVVLGLAHRGQFTGVALMDGDVIETPLGQVELDQEAGAILAAQSPLIYFNYSPHIGEHSAENEIPFLQAALPGTKTVVGIIGDHYSRTLDELVAALVELAKSKKILVIASSDMMHHPDYELVTGIDKETLERVKVMDHAAIYEDWRPSKQTFCGVGPVVAVMRFAESQGCRKGTVLHYRNTGDDFPESRGQWVVGYASVVFAAPD